MSLHKVRDLFFFTPVFPTFKIVFGTKKVFKQYVLNKLMPVKEIRGFNNALMFSSGYFGVQEYDI